MTMRIDPDNRHNLDWLVAIMAVLALAGCLLVEGCTPTTQSHPAVAAAQSIGDAQAEVADAVEDPVSDAQRNITEATTQAVVAVQDVVQQALPPAQPAAPAMPAAATRLIVRWEVSSPGYYTQRLAHPMWPGGSSGVTWGIGYDGGQQTAETIRNDWAAHADVDRLAATAGIAGTRAKTLALSLRTVTTPFAYARDVFSASTLPRYHAAAGRALGDGFAQLDDGPQGALDSLGYNRGWSMLGPNRREMREIRDTCVPAGDGSCIAAQLRSMKRLWPNVRGLRDRREDEARTAEGSA